MTSPMTPPCKMASSESAWKQIFEETILSPQPLLICLSLSLKAVRGGVAQLISSSSDSFVFPLHFYPDFEDNGNHLEDQAFICVFFVL